MASDYVDMRTISQQIAADLRYQIITGTVRKTLPSFSQLAATYTASVNACQNAVQTLKDEGLVTGAQGKALTVHRPKVRVIPAGAYLEPTRGKLRYERLAVGRVKAPDIVAELLELELDSMVVSRGLLTVIDAEPAELAQLFFPLPVADGTALAEDAPVMGGTQTLLADLGFPGRSMQDVITDGAPTREEAKRLRLPSYASVIRTFRVIRSDAGRPVQASILTKAGQRSAVGYSIDLH